VAVAREEVGADRAFDQLRREGRARGVTRVARPARGDPGLGLLGIGLSGKDRSPWGGGVDHTIKTASRQGLGPSGSRRRPHGVRLCGVRGRGDLWDGGLAHAPPSVAFGKDVLVSGKTDPAVAGQRMTIRAARMGGRGPKDLATVRIGGDGTFGYRWRPAVLGDYAIGALYRSQSPALADDFSEARTLRIAPPRNRLRPGAIVVRGSLRRPRAAGAAGCTGKVRLRVAVGKRRLLSTRFRIRRTCRYRARRRFMLRSPRARFVTARASYLGDRVLQRRSGRAVRVKIHR